MEQPQGSTEQPLDKGHRGVATGLVYAFPRVATSNFGDHIIVHATRQLLDQLVGPPAFEIDVAADETVPPEADCLLVPGITRIRPGPTSYERIMHNCSCPTYCLAGSFWSPSPRPGMLLRTRVLGAQQNVDEDLSIVRRFADPVGVRDPYTLDVLDRAHIPTAYLGCPTLHMPADDVADDGFVLFSFGRGCVRRQTRAARALSRHANVVGLCHEDGEYEAFRAAGWKLPLVTYRGDIEAYLSYIKRAHIVITGRLHGLLPALAYGKSVFYFGTTDTRTTLLDDVGVRAHPYASLSGALDKASPHHNRLLARRFRMDWSHMLARIAQRAAAARRTDR